MRSRYLIRIFTLLGALIFGLTLFSGNASADVAKQQPTGVIPTVTGTPSGPIATVNSDNAQINVRSGPNTFYPEVGILVAGQQVVAIGRTPGGDWIQIVYPGVPEGVAWIYSGLVRWAREISPLSSRRRRLLRAQRRPSTRLWQRNSISNRPQPAFLHLRHRLRSQYLNLKIRRAALRRAFRWAS